MKDSFIEKHLKRIQQLIIQYEMKKHLIKTIGYTVAFIARDSKKEYPHGYGVSDKIFIPENPDIDPADVHKLAKKLFSNDEFDVLMVLPIAVYQEKSCIVDEIDNESK